MSPAKVSCLLAFVTSCLGAMANEIRFERIDLTASASGHCLVPVTVDGHDARFIVDSGAGTVIVLAKAYAESIGKDLAVLEGGTALGGGIEMHKTDVGQFKLGTTFPPLKFGGLQVVDLKTFGGILGVQTLAALDAFVDLGSYSLGVPAKFQRGSNIRSLSPH